MKKAQAPETTRPGNFVLTRTGFTGRTYDGEALINGKQPVYLSDGKRLLCDPATLKTIGFTS